MQPSLLYTISDNADDMDIDNIHGFLKNAYWSRDIPREVIEKAIANSLVFGVFHATKGQVGFARMITDTATLAYLADVFILTEHRGKGLSKLLMQAIIDHPELQGLPRMVLATRDAHGLYEQYGFKALAEPDIFMELWKPDVYKS